MNNKENVCYQKCIGENYIAVTPRGRDAMVKLNKAGLKVFSVICMVVLETKNDKEVILSYPALIQTYEKMSVKRSSFYKGLKNCVENGIVTKAKGINLYFVNREFLRFGYENFKG